MSPHGVVQSPDSLGLSYKDTVIKMIKRGWREEERHEHRQCPQDGVADTGGQRGRHRYINKTWEEGKSFQKSKGRMSRIHFVSPTELPLRSY